MFLPVAQRPANFRRIGLSPPSVQLGTIQSPVHQHLHAAGAARFPGPPRRVEPQIHALHQMLRQPHVVVGQKHGLRACRTAPDKLHPFADHLLSGSILRMRLARQNQLHRPAPVGEDSQQPVRIFQQQIRTFVRGEAPREPHRQRVGVEDAARLRHFVLRGSMSGQLPRQPRPQILHHGFARLLPHVPEIGVGRPAKLLVDHSQRAAPPVFATDGRPQFVCFGGIPRGYVDAVRHVPHRHLCSVASAGRAAGKSAGLPRRAAGSRHSPRRCRESPDTPC